MFFKKQVKKIEEEVSTHWNDLKDILCEEIDFGVRFRILLVDDDPMDRAIVRRGISNENVFVDEAECPIEALQKIEKKRYELIVIDFHMPIMDGIELVSKIREKKSIKVIFTSMDLTNEDKDKINDLGGYYVSKDQVQDLVSMVNGMVVEYQNS